MLRLALWTWTAGAAVVSDYVVMGPIVALGERVVFSEPGNRVAFSDLASSVSISDPDEEG